MSRSLMRDGRPRSYVAIITMLLLTLLWCIPTLGVLVTSFRTRDDAVGVGLVDGAVQPGLQRTGPPPTTPAPGPAPRWAPPS